MRKRPRYGEMCYIFPKDGIDMEQGFYWKVVELEDGRVCIGFHLMKHNGNEMFFFDVSHIEIYSAEDERIVITEVNYGAVR